MKRKIQVVEIEVTTLRAHARDAISGAHTQAERLADIARSLISTLDFFNDADEIRARAPSLDAPAMPVVQVMCTVCCYLHSFAWVAILRSRGIDV